MSHAYTCVYAGVGKSDNLETASMTMDWTSYYRLEGPARQPAREYIVATSSHMIESWS